MKKIYITDTTLCTAEEIGFKEKIEIIRCLDKMQVDVIDLPPIKNDKTDPLLIATVAPLLTKSRLCLDVGRDINKISAAAQCVAGIQDAELRISVPVSAVGMEYSAHIKPKNALTVITSLITEAKKYSQRVSFCAEDATRADISFLQALISAVVEAGVTGITLCDDAGNAIPDEFESFVNGISSLIPENVLLNVACNNNIHMATACSVSAISVGAGGIKTSISGVGSAKIAAVLSVLRARGDFWGVTTNVNITCLESSIAKIQRIINPGNSTEQNTLSSSNEAILDKNDDIVTVSQEIRKLGYDLSAEDERRVYEEFLRVASKKTVTCSELDAIVAGTALQVTPTYTLVSYLINSSNIILPSAHIKLSKNGEVMEDVCMGDGPIDAAFRTIESIIGHHYELDDFRIESVTRGREAVGSAVVRLRSGGKLYSGTGISTDIISASIRAYISALNKIVYEEN